jgi:predicted ArsR family transcriptional regulator
MSGAALTDAKRRIIERLKRSDQLTALELAGEFGITDTAIRQHLEALSDVGLVERISAAPIGRGRPAVLWRLTETASTLFPDRHGELTVELLTSLRETLGEAALEQVIDARSARQLDVYRSAVEPSTSVVQQVRRIAELRSAEGYMAEAVVDESADADDPDAAVTLIEHHCPIAGAAGACPGLCTAELELFRRTLGPSVRVERTQHLLAGAARCAYRISAA